ncbi:MAG TPA: hypothetical protein VFB25_01540 [Gaiellaceae bacterium]|nr:hypothetical protein [Gaiellaceae bacterium]
MSSLAAGLTRPFALPRLAWWWAPASLVVAAVTWPAGSLSTSALDAYWPVGLHLAAQEGLAPGRDVVFTYGPLAFLAFPVLVGTATAIAAFAFTAAVHLALVVVVLRTTAKRLPWPAALTCAVVAGAAPVPAADAPVLLVLAVCLASLADDTRVHLSRLALGGGALAALELLVKVNDGLVCLVLLALTVWRSRRASLLLAAGFLASFAALWRVAGGRYGDLGTWARLSLHLLASYAQGMALRGPVRDLELSALLLVALAAIAVAQTRTLPRLRGLATWLSLACFGFAFFKEGFVREDAAHETVFFAAFAVALLVVDWVEPEVRLCALLLAAIALHGPGGSADAAGETALGVVAAWLAARTFGRRRILIVLAPVAVAAGLVFEHGLAALPASPSVSAVANEARLLASASQRGAMLAGERSDVRRREPLTAAMLASLRGHTVDVEPYGATIAWGYGLDWRPEGVVESYAAYDPALDSYAARTLTAQRILQLPWSGIDDHNALWQAPALVLAELCDYRVAAGDPSGATVLARTPSRCGSRHRLGTAYARLGVWLSVPKAAHSIVYASIAVHTTLANTVRSLVLRPAEVRIDARGTGGGTFGVVPATATDGLVLRLPHDRSLPQPAGGTAIARFRLTGAPSARVTFYALPLH